MRTDKQLPSQARDHRQWDIVKYFETARIRAKNSFSGGERDHLFLSDHGQRFVDVGPVSGLDHPGDGRSCVVWDFDRDGRVEFAVAATNKPLLNWYRQSNTAPSGQFLAVRLVGGARTAEPSSEWSNRDGVGAVLRIQAGDRELVREFRAGEGLAAQNSSCTIVGLGAQATAQRVDVRWPSGRVSQAVDVAAGSMLTFHEDPATGPSGDSIDLSSYARSLSPVATAPGGVAPPAGSGSGHGHSQVGDIFPLANEASTGKLRVYTSMATWCAACKRWLPQLVQLQTSLGPERVVLFGVPVDETDGADALAAYDLKFAPPYNLLRELTGPDRARVQQFFVERLRTEALPASVVVDDSGRALWVGSGVPTVSDLVRLERAVTAR